jgi:hypothetical protein
LSKENHVTHHSYEVIAIGLDSRKSFSLATKDFWDFIDVDLANTTADINRIYWSFDGAFWRRLSDVIGLYVVFRSFKLKWEDSEIGKNLVLILGREYRYYRFYGSVIIAGASTNVPIRIATSDIAVPTDLQFITDAVANRIGLHANAYRLLTLDLGVARTDALIADNVVSFCIADASAGATYSIKLFSATNDPIDQSIASKGFCMERLARANLYLSNVAQSGYYLKLLVMRLI